MYYERNLPHWQPPGKELFVTWRLSGSLPVAVIEKLQGKGHLPEGRQFREFDRYLDQRLSGPQWLRDPRIAGKVVGALREAERRGYCSLHAFVVMPNHVHVLLGPRVELRKFTKWVKGSTGREANKILCRQGRLFWQDESFDHWIRNSAQFERARVYIEGNPVTARLVREPSEWPWSSAGG
jgi:putative transposase